MYGQGLAVDNTFVPVPQEAWRLAELLARRTPGLLQEVDELNDLCFAGNDLPSVPGPIKSQALTAALHGLAVLVSKQILRLRGIQVDQVYINTDAAALYCATPVAWSVGDKTSVELMRQGNVRDYVPLFDDGLRDSALKFRATAIYPTKEHSVYYQLHGSTNPSLVLEALGIDIKEAEAQYTTREAAFDFLKSITEKKTAEELDTLFTAHGLCGSTCFSPQGWLQTSMGREMQMHNLIKYTQLTEAGPSSALPSLASLADQRPLVGLKVVELARIIAAPALGQNLAAMGAKVVKVQARHLVDLSYLQFTLTAGKETVDLDIRSKEGSTKLKALLKDADVIIDGFRPGALARYGISIQTLLQEAERCGRGIVYVNESCFDAGKHAWSDRPGWQQVADAAAGSSYVMGRAYGYTEGECVLPSLPISDMSTGAVGFLSCLLAIRDRHLKGGSYLVDAALTKYNMVSLEPQVGLYGQDTVDRIQERWQFPRMTPAMHVNELFFVIHEAWSRNGGPMADKSLFTTFERAYNGLPLTLPSPMVRFSTDGQASQPAWSTPPVAFAQKSVDEVLHNW